MDEFDPVPQSSKEPWDSGRPERPSVKEKAIKMVHDVLEFFCKWRIHESDQFKTVPETHEIEIHQKMSKPEY